MVKMRMIPDAVVVGKIGTDEGQVESELALGFTGVEPLELHVHGVDIFGNDCVLGDFNSSGVAGLDRRHGLRPTQFDE